MQRADTSVGVRLLVVGTRQRFGKSTSVASAVLT